MPVLPSTSATRTLFLVELKGGNDGLNTVVPHADPLYAQYRPTIAIKSADVLPLSDHIGLHPALAPLHAMWGKGELAVVQGVGYPQPNLSHFRSIEIWETASKSAEYLSEGWCTRAFASGLGAASRFTTHGVLVGGSDFGPLLGAQAVTLNNPEAFVNQSRFANTAAPSGPLSMQHVLKVEADIQQAAQGLRADKFEFKTAFPATGFGNAVRAAAQVMASQRGKRVGEGGVPVIRLTMGGFDTHQNQPGTHAALLKQLAEGLEALKGAMTELGAWERSLVLTYSEFGRRPKQNQSNGTDHGTVAPHFAMGGTVKGGLYGQAPNLAQLDATQNMLHTTDYRQMYATVAKDWWGIKPEAVVRGAYEPLAFLRG